MGWSGRAPAPPVSEPCQGRQSQGARYVSATQHDDRRDWCRYRQELVPHRRSRSARRHSAAAEVVTWPGGTTVCEHAALPDRDGGLRRGTSSQSQAQGSWSRCPADASEVRSPLFEGTEERLPRRGGDRRGGPTANDEVRSDENRRSARPAGDASVRERLVSQRTGIMNQIRAFLLECGVAVRQGQRFLRAELPRILTTPPDVLSPRMVRVIEDLAGDWRRLHERIEGLSGEIEAIARRDAGCERLMSVPGIRRKPPSRSGRAAC